LPLILFVALAAGYDDIYWPCDGSNLLLVNNGDGSFTEDATNAGVGVGGANQRGALWGDFNRDGFMDIFGGTNDGPDYLYLNDGDSTFTLSTSAAGLATSGGLANTAGDVS
jgi:hypothetical protein